MQMSNSSNTPSPSHFLERVPVVIGSGLLVAAALFALADPVPDRPGEAAAAATADQYVTTRRGLRGVTDAGAASSETASMDQGAPVLFASLQTTTEGMILTRRGQRSAPPIAEASPAGDPADGPVTVTRSRR